MYNKSITIQARVTGKVQGVYFRKFVLANAQKLQLKGWVKNNKDGSVELKASGPRDSVMTLIDLLWQGPPQAQVSNVEWQEIAVEELGVFVIL